MKRIFCLLIFISLLGSFSANLDMASAQTSTNCDVDGNIIESRLVFEEEHISYTHTSNPNLDPDGIPLNPDIMLHTKSTTISGFNVPADAQVYLSASDSNCVDIIVDNYISMNGETPTETNNICNSVSNTEDHSCNNGVISGEKIYAPDGTPNHDGEPIGNLLEPIPVLNVTQYIPDDGAPFEIILGDYGIIRGNTALYLIIVQEVDELDCNLTNFTLIDSETDLSVPGFDPIPNGAEISINDLPSNVSIRANGSGSDIASVGFELIVPDGLDGDMPTSNTEGTFPWTSWGNDGNDYFGNSLTPGEYTVIASAYTEADRGGIMCDQISITFSVTTDDEPAPVCELTGFSLLDSVNDAVVSQFDPIADGDVIGLDVLPSEASIRANGVGNIGSIGLTLTGAVSHTRTENHDEFTLFGNNDEDYLGQSLPVGEYTVTANAYTEDGLNGQLCATLTINFTISEEISPPPPPPACPAEVTSFGLVNAGTDEISPLSNGQVIDLADFPSGINFVANTNDATEEVMFTLSGASSHQNLEGTSPFALFGNDENDYFAWDGVTGDYTLNSIPSADGVACEGSAISFSIIDSSAP